MLPHRAHGGRDSDPAVHGPAHPSALCPDQTLPAPTQDSDGTEATRRHVTPRSAARPGSCTYRLGDPDGGPSTNAWYDYDMAPYRIHCGRDPAAPPRPVPWYPAKTRTVTPDGELRRHPCHSALRNAAAHGSDQLYTHRLGRSYQPAHPRCARQRPSHHTFHTPTDINVYADSPPPFRL